MADSRIIERQLGRREYHPVWRAMQDFTAARSPDWPDEIWLLDHPPIYTQGRAGRTEHILDPGDIPVVRVDRGGQVTYHGPGQLVVYTLIDLGRRAMGVRQFVDTLELAVIDTLRQYGIQGQRRPDAPGVYVGDAKIASLGLRVRRGCCYHGLSLNVAMDLAPFRGIEPCGLPGVAVTQLSALCPERSLERVAQHLVSHLAQQLGSTAAPAATPAELSGPGVLDISNGHALPA